MEKLTAQKLEAIFAQNSQKRENWIKVGMSTCGIAAGADEVYKTFVNEIAKRNVPMAVKKCGCLGMCHVEPLVEVNVSGMPTVIYAKVTPEVAVKIIEKHILTKTLLNDHIFALDLGARS